MRRSSVVSSYLAVVLLGFFMAVNYQLFIVENAFAPAGLSGIATMIQYKLNFSIGYFTLLINLPLCAVAFFVQSREFALKNLLYCLSYSGFMLLLSGGGYLDGFAYTTGYSTLLAPLAAGVVSGLISGCLVRLDATTGGTDILASFIHKKDPDFSLFKIIFALNGAVALASYFVYDYRFEPVLLCLVYCFLSSRVGDAVIRGGRTHVKYEIITKDYEGLKEDILRNLRHSATVIDAKGMFSGDDTHLVICLVNPHQVARFRQILLCHEGTFAYTSSISEVIGNFKHISRLSGRTK